MDDRLTTGFIAGMVGGLAMNILNLISCFFCHFAKCLYLQWAAVLLYGTKASNLAETLVAQIAQLIFTGFLSIIFAYLTPMISSKYLLFKGWLFGVLAWFFIYAVFILFQLPEFGARSLETVLSNFITASVYGLVQAEVFRRYSKRISNP